MTPEELARAFKGRPHLDSLWQKISSGVSDFTLEDQVELEVAEAHMHHERGNFATALKQGERALARAQGIKYTKGIASALQILALVYLRLGDYVQCAESARQSLSLDQGTLDAADAWRMLADCALFTDDFSNALIYFERAIKLSQKFGYTFGYLASLNSVSILHYAQGRFDQALTGYNEAGNHVEASDYAKSFCLINSASIYLTTNQRGQARDTMNRLAPYAEGSELIDAYLRVWRAWLAIDEEDFEHAETAFQHARTLVEAQGIAPVRQMLRIQYSRLQRLRGDSARALAWAKEAVKFAESTNSHWFVGVAMIERARAWWMLDDFVTTEKDLLSALDVAQNLGAEYLAAEATLLLAALRHRQKSADADATWLDAARRIKIGGYGFILERERALAFPLVAAQTRSRKPDVQSAASTMLENLSNIAPLPLRVFGLGRFEMWQGRRRIPSGEWQKRHSGELFRFLLLQPRHTAARDIIFESLCRDQSAESAQIYLHHATSTLRHLLEPELPDKFPSRYIVIEGEQVEL